ncbi:hypothetical protein G6011_00302 [Alternaria panax]|uniref:Uncharacterized protein n=1 Tax=Alternaria panax TaxID=48097 RepID=A0AAD4IIG3_9PLEO|nr:hypothetical protein G6011_00302 [Alternaria panax]
MVSIATENETLQDFLLNAMAPRGQDESSIAEFQAALGPLLLTRASPSGSTFPAPSEQALPKWTGAFKPLTLRRSYEINVPLLGLFPDSAADALTDVSHVYHDTIVRPTGRFHKRQKPGGTFLDSLRAVHVISERFPKLKVFDAKDGSRKNAVDMWLSLMRRWLQKGNVVPLGCVWLNVQGFRADGFGEELDEAANEAYQILVKESKHREDTKASGKMWLEKMEETSMRERKGKGEKKAAHEQ